MKGLDTNVLVRYLVKDDPVQSEEAAAYITTHCSVSTPGFINRVVVCELVWVLETAYRFQRGEIARVLEMILNTEEFQVEDHADTFAALQAYRDFRMDFADALIGTTNRRFGCEETGSFDQRACHMNEFALIGKRKRPPKDTRKRNE